MQAILVITVDESLVEMVRTVADDLYEVLHITDITERNPEQYASLVVFDATLDPVGASEHLRAMQKPSYGVLVITDAGHAELIPEYIEAGAVDVLVRHLHPDLLARRVRALIHPAREYIGLLLSELQGALGAIPGYSDLLLRQAENIGTLTEIQQGFIHNIWQNAIYIRSMHIRIRDLVSLETGHLKLNPSRQRMDALIDFALKQQSLVDVISRKPQRIASMLDENLPLVAADEYRIGQVLDVMVQNAAKYSPPETTITIGAKHVGQVVQVAIADQGVGISPTDAPFVFQRFFSGLHELVREQRGFGVGLYFARYIIRKHGGDIWFESALGKGTTFYFTLPIAQPETA